MWEINIFSLSHVEFSQLNLGWASAAISVFYFWGIKGSQAGKNFFYTTSEFLVQND